MCLRLSLAFKPLGLFPPRLLLPPLCTLALLLQCEPEINRAALMEVPAAVGCAGTHTHAHTHTDVCAAFSADWAPHRMFCGAKNRNHLQSGKKKRYLASPCLQEHQAGFAAQAGCSV